MSRVFLVQQDGYTTPLERLECKNEDEELQTLLERNPDLLPGDQISPDTPIRWLLIKREMPVVSPASGETLWSVDFLLSDNFGIPTIVECKRANDPASRRAVVGQMLDYAANGRQYWTASEFRSHAQTTAGGEAELKRKIAELTESETPEEFFSKMEQNLRRSKLRLVFFLERSSHELRSIVEFLNDQFKDVDVMIVEARQYEQEGFRVVVPFLFGFTEQARVSKRESRAETVRSLPVKGEEPFWEAIQNSSVSEGAQEQIREFVNSIRKIPGYSLRWQISCLISIPDEVVPQKILFGIKRNGNLELYLAKWRPLDGRDLSPAQETSREAYFEAIRGLFALDESELKKVYPQVSAKDWVPKADQFLVELKTLTCFKATMSEGEA